jgi:hypothetical protein
MRDTIRIIENLLDLVTYSNAFGEVETAFRVKEAEDYLDLLRSTQKSYLKDEDPGDETSYGHGV